MASPTHDQRPIPAARLDPCFAPQKGGKVPGFEKCAGSKQQYWEWHTRQIFLSWKSAWVPDKSSEAVIVHSVTFAPCLTATKNFMNSATSLPGTASETERWRHMPQIHCFIPFRFVHLTGRLVALKFLPTQKLSISAKQTICWFDIDGMRETQTSLR